jgi:hypothetical protein
MVLVDEADEDLHYVHHDFYKLLGRLRANIDIVDDTSVQLAYRKDDDGNLEFCPSTKENILQILDRLVRADIIQVQLWRADDCDQVSKPGSFLIECALQSNGPELVKLESTQLSHLFQVRPLVLQWVRTGNFPSTTVMSTPKA